MLASALSTAGLILTLAGVVVLFRYGMPYRVRRGGDSYLLLDAKDQQDIRQERIYDALGWCGLAAIVVGTGVQIAVVWMK